MNEGTTRCRIAILAFEEASLLQRAARELLLHGFNSSQFCLFGHSYVLATVQSLALTDDSRTRELDGLLKAPPIRVKLANAAIFEMRCGTFAGSLFTLIDTGLVEATWMRADLALGVAHDISNGCLVLLVTSETADQHALGARLLLRHGNRDLLTHEFTVGR